jgi:hypothetical protein
MVVSLHQQYIKAKLKMMSMLMLMNKLKLKVKARTKIVVMTKEFLKSLLKKLKLAVQGKWKKLSARGVIPWIV